MQHFVFFCFTEDLNTTICELGSGAYFTVHTYATIVLYSSHIFTTVIATYLDFHLSNSKQKCEFW